MRRSIATVTLSGTLTEKLEAIARARFDGVEIFENDLLFHLGPPREIREICNDLNLTVDLYQPFRDFETKDHKQFLSNLERAERKFDVMQELGAPLVLVCSNVSDMAPDDAQTAEQLHALGERAALRNLKIGYEALSWGKTIYRFDQAYKAVMAANHAHVGLIVDSFHTLALPDDWSGLNTIRGDKIFFVQLADAPRLGMNPLPLSRHHRVLPGQGDFDVSGFMEKVLKTGYNGIISLEIFNDDFRAAPARDTATDAMRSLLLLEEEVRLRAVTPFKRTILFTPPATPEISRISFAEFAVDKASDKALGEFITPFGFEKLGTHKSKDVSLWGAGSARFVLNKEPDSFAASYHLMHGTSVCAIAVECDDALGAAARAESFHLNRYEGRIGPNEHSIPAVRANDGSLIYFTDNDETKTALFESDFNVKQAHSAIKYGDIDHIAYALPEGSMESRLLFYRLLLGLKAEDMHALADPLGLTFSRTVSNISRTIRLPLNVSESRKTATARSLDVFMGAGVTHIAIKTDDIFGVARLLLKNKAQVLPIADNYYDDLAARFQLDESLVDEMKELHILYDKDANGEFFHLYSLPFESRFFIEIVQRQKENGKGYDGYGVANAPHRLASLHRYRHLSKVLQD